MSSAGRTSGWKEQGDCTTVEYMLSYRSTSVEQSVTGVGTAFTCAQDGQGVWYLRGELDADGVPQLSDRLIGVEGDVTLDCSGLTFLDSSGLALFVTTHRACRARGAKLAIVNPSPCVIRLLELTGLSTLLTVPSARSAP
jgi:stage II sporulation protein AA (anti-sigma F factor antagonist)